MRVWIDLTNSPHVLVMRPVIELLREDGHEVRVTARDFAQTLALCERFGIEHTAIGRHRGERLRRQGASVWRRARRRSCAGRAPSGALPAGARFDIALGHGSNDVSVAAALLRMPSSTMFDYEWATVQHNVNCRLARAVVVPDAIPPERLYRYGARGKLRALRGAQGGVLPRRLRARRRRCWRSSGSTASAPIVVVRTPPEVSLYHRFENDLFAEVLERLRAAAAADGVQPVVLPRVASQREQLAGVPGFVVPERAIDAQSLIAYSDLVISAGGTMNREAVALGVPVYTTFEGRAGRRRRAADRRRPPAPAERAGAARSGRARADLGDGSTRAPRSARARSSCC